ncbi:12258_t:CDS:2 [Funneliformis caledonium]|uniref:12258_t:CDS:1 n=1 Tax=Funneliformis caledonium TaxID=1117310 RepID=A0A9N9GL79_9GLOM|nr:12258_t:CDS:2 [Funneliformis caledonium]
MASTYLRPLANPKRVKLVSTCDVCKNRKVKCDKERPECGTCKKTNRKCSYTYAAFTESIREKQNGLRSQADSSFLQTQLNYLQNVQFGQLYEESGFLSMASRSFGIEANNGQNIAGMLSMPMTSMAADVNNYGLDATSLITTEVLQNSTNVAASIQRDAEQCQYDPTYYLNCTDFAALLQNQQQNLYQTQSTDTLQSQQTQQYQQSQQNQQLQFMNQEVNSGDNVVDDLASNIENLKLYESTRYIGEGSLLLLDDDNFGEMIIPQIQPDLSQVNDSLKILPNIETIEQLINLYFKHVHRYFPALRQQTVWNALRDLNRPQHLLLLNCIFFAASPFHEDPDKKDGRIYFDRAEALLYEYCTLPHALTVMSIIILGRHNKQMGANWMYSGIATKMLFELGLHRKFKDKIREEVEQLRNEAFWMCFISENFVSATYGRPNMIDETDCDVDVPNMLLSPYPMDENARLEIAYIYLINLSRICARVRKYLHASRLRVLVRDDENKFRILDAALANWSHSLPGWLRFEEIAKDPDGALLNGVGGDITIFFHTVLILLHIRHLKPPEEYQMKASNSSVICMQSATIIVHCLEVLLEKHPDFFALASSGPFAISPAMRVFSWHAKYDENKKADEMLKRLEVIRSKIMEISKSYDRGRVDGEGRMDGEHVLTEWLGIPTHPRNRMIDNDTSNNLREWEVFIADDDRNLRRQYSWIARKQSGGIFMPKRKTSSFSRSMSMNSNSSIYMKGRSYSSTFDFMNSSQNMEDLNFTFKTDKSFDFSAFSQLSGQNSSLPQVTLDGVLVEEPEQFDQDHKQFGGNSQYHTPLQQSPQLQPQQFNSPYHSPVQRSPQLQASDYHTPLNLSPQLNPQDYNSPYQQSPQLQSQDYVANINTMLTPPMQPSDFFSETSLDDIASDEFWNVLHNETNNHHLGNSSIINDSGLSDGLNGNENECDFGEVGLGISVENNK